MRRRRWSIRNGMKRGLARLRPSYQAMPNVSGHRAASVRSTVNSTKVKASVALILLALTVLVTASWFLGTKNAEQEQLGRLAAAMSAQDFSTANEVIQTLLHASPQNEAYLWTSATIEEELGHAESAHAIRTSLATRGHGPAVLWLIDQRFRLDDVASWSDEQHAEFPVLFESSSKWTPAVFIELTRRRAAYLTLRGELHEAIDALMQISHWEPQANVHIATLFLRLGDRARAESSAAIARAALENQVQQKPDDAVARLQLARSLTILACEGEALVCLADGFEKTRQPEMQQAAGEVLISWAKRLEHSDGVKKTFWPRLQLIHRASQCAPQDMIVIESVLALIEECRAERLSRMEELREATARGIERLAAHSMLGWLHALEMKHEIALQHLQVAMADSPETPTLLNNLALYLVDRSNDDPEKALMLINLADALLPAQPHFAETRGRVLMKMFRWKEAITALNQALVAEKLRFQVYSQLSVAHEKIGDSESAARYKLLQSQVHDRGKL